MNTTENLSKKILFSLAAMLLVGARFAIAATVSTTTHDPTPGGLDSLIDTADLIQGLIGSDDGTGWHTANPNPAGALATLTDGSGTGGVGAGGAGLAGLPNDSPGDGVPAKTVEYSLGGAFDIEKIQIFSDWGDGRTFTTTAIYISDDGGSNFTLLSYFQSDPSGTSNSPVQFNATLVELADDQGGMISFGTTDIRFEIYAGSNGVVSLDPFSGTNPFTGADDTGVAAIASPALVEIDVIGQVAPNRSADFDVDSDVDGKDFLTWQSGFGATNGALLADGDADEDGAINAVDLAILESQFGLPTAFSATTAAIPEPTALLSILIGMGLFIGVNRGAGGRS